MRLPVLPAAGAAVLLLCAPAFAAPDVVVSIKPLHSLVASVMGEVGQPKLIVEGVGSPHTYAMKPSNASDLAKADLVFWAGDQLEAFLVKPLETLATTAKVVELIETPGLKRLPYREGGPFEAHGHEDDDHDAAAGDAAHTKSAGQDLHDHAASETGHDHEEHGDGYDMHVWLDPDNARVMAAEIERQLAAMDPENAATYRANTAKLNARLDGLIARTNQTLAGVKGKPFIVFHDAYQYFETRFEMAAAGSITVNPETMPGVQRISEIKTKTAALGATCVFAEPQFEPKLIETVSEGTGARTGTLDPEGAALANGPDLYFQLIDNLATSLSTCLSQPD
ncbi:zinc ABC transporter substrate-binding protein [Aureimonas sp. Leaf454]|uniref:zinc ABC transporter substrate-binding protein n=1 Tax=Aureimonas sp. Leaf454 TaxID=1736381 RepID=UPI000B16EA0D|nr:zinc ABC transporter substrate-binding protein [Aureimonas sp. Leaf454]